MTAPPVVTEKVWEGMPDIPDDESPATAPPPPNNGHKPRAAKTTRPEWTDTEPHDYDAERAVLGAALLAPDLIPELAGILHDDDLWHPAHIAIWTTITDLHATGAPVDVLTVATAIGTDRTLKTLRGPVYISDLVNAIPNTASASHHARRLARLGNQRRIIRTAKRLIQAAHGDDPHALADVVEATRGQLEKASRDAATGRRPEDWDDFWARPAEPPDLLAAGILARGRITLLYAPGKTGKSLLAQEAAVRLALSAPTFGDPAREILRVLYVDQEMTLDDWRDRLVDMQLGPDDPLDALALYSLADWAPFDTAEGGAQLAAAAQAHRADVVIIDTLSKVCQGEENSNDTFQAFYRHTLIPLKRAGRAALVLDHTGKDLERGARGGRSKTDNVDLVFEMLTRGKDLLSLKRTHTRFRHPTELMYFRRRTDPFLTHEFETIDENAEKIIDVCLSQLRSFEVEQKESGATVLKRFRGYGSKFTDATFYAAWSRYRHEKGWDA